MFFETSAKDDVNVADAFENGLSDYIQTHEIQFHTPSGIVLKRNQTTHANND